MTMRADTYPQEESQKRAAIYCRVSDINQKDNGSLEDQEARGRRWCNEHRYEVVSVQHEVYSAEGVNRPKLQELQEQVRLGNIDVIVVDKVDRFSRADPAITAYIMVEAKQYGCDVEFVEVRDDSFEGKILSAVLSIVAQVELKRIKERTVAGRHRRVVGDPEKGKPPRLMPGGTPRYGWRWNDENKERYVIVEHEAEVFHRIYRELADEGKTIYQICGDLETEGEPSPSMAFASKPGVNVGKRHISNRWHEASLAHMLREPCYWGEAVYNRKKKYVRLDRDPKTNRIVEKHLQRNRSLDDVEVIHYPPELWPPIVDKDLAMRAISRLDQNQREAERVNKNKGKSFLRAGYIFCGYCHDGMFLHSHFASRRGKSNHALRFVCGKHLTFVNHRTPHDCEGGGKYSIRLSQVEDAVWEEILTALADPDRVPDAYEQLTRKEGYLREQRRKRIQGLNELIDGASARKDSYLQALGATQDSGVRADLLRLAEEQSVSIRKWETIRSQIQAEIQQQLAENSEVRSFIRHINSFLASMLNPNIAEKRRMAQRLGIKVYCYRHEHQPWFEMISNLPGINATWHMQRCGRLPAVPVKDAEPNHTSVVRSEMLDKWVLSDARIHAALPATSRTGRPTENASEGQPPWLDPDERERVRILAERYG